MSDIEDLTRRISEALERAASTIEGIGAPAGNEADLSEALEAEKTANAQLEERVKAIREKQETLVSELEAQVASLTETLESRDKDLQQIRSVNATLRETTAKLREANAAGLADADLVNASLQSELDAALAAMETDANEIAEVMASLDAIVKEAADA